MTTPENFRRPAVQAVGCPGSRLQGALMSRKTTDPLLQAGGLYVYHDAIFDAITNEDVCPFVNPN